MNTFKNFRFAVCCGSIFAVCGCQTASRVAKTEAPRVPEATAQAQAAAAPAASPAAEADFSLPAESRFSDVLLTNFAAPEPTAAATDGGQASPTELPPAPISAKEANEANPERSLIPAATGPGLTLEMVEQIAMNNNPAIFQASASASKAAGFREQVGAYPNPNVGYSGQQLADAGTDQHLGYVQQDIISAHKLRLNQLVLDHEVQSQLWEVETQRYRVLTDVRQRFYDALAAQQRRDLARDFHNVASEGVRIAEIRRKALEGSVPEVLQTEIQLNEVDLILQRSEIAYEAAWKQLISIAGVPTMAPIRLIGELRVSSEKRDWDATYMQLVGSSPALQAARARVSRSIANMTRQEVQAIPNLQTLTSAGYDYGSNHSMIQVQMGVALPIFNKNVGNISAAQAEYCRAAQDVRRMELSLQSRLAVAARQYDSAAITVERYETHILPKARQTLELSEKAYTAGEFGFLQVLVARRTFFDSNLQYNQALIELAEAKWLIDGMLLDGGLNDTSDTSMDDALRGQTLSGQ